MKRRNATLTASILAAGLVLSQSSLVTLAAGTDTALVGLSSAAKATEATYKVMPAMQETEEAAEETAAAADTAAEETAAEGINSTDVSAAVEETAAAEETGAPVEEETEALDTSMVGTTGFAQCSEYLNVRTDASTDADVAGKIYNNGSLEILDVLPGGWYQVRSGNVQGYVAADYVAVGENAASIAADAGYTTAQLGVDGLNIRAGASTDADVIGTATEDHSLEVVEDQGDWLKVLVDGEMYGYIAADYVSTTTEYATGETLEEEQARLDQEWLAYLAQQEAERQAAEAAYLAAISQQQASAPVQSAAPAASSADTSDLSARCSNAWNAYLAAQEAADAAVANGDGEDAIISTAAAATEAYAAYLSLQNQLDAANAGLTAAAATTQTSSASTGSSDLSTQCNDAYDAYLAAQEAADAAVANGDGEEAIVSTAAAATDAYEAYLDLQDQVDTAAYTETADDTYAEETSDDGTDDVYTEEGVEEEVVEEASAPAASSAGASVANYATQFVGNPYVYGGSSLTGGADCSGFTMAVYAQFGVSLPHNAAAQSGCGTAVSLDALQPGDLLFYDGGGGIGHVTMYIGNGQVVHASNPSNGIMISSMSYRTPVCARRFV